MRRLYMRSALDSERIEILNYMKDTFRDDIRRDVLRGLTSRHKFIPSKYFYDAYGSKLFEEICTLPEYYQTRTELSILKSSAADIVGRIDEADMIEFGSGSNLKARTLLDACFRKPKVDMRYVPVDVSESALVESAVGLLDLYADLRILGIVADFTKNTHKVPRGRQKLFLLLGSTIGNFLLEERIGLLRNTAAMMAPGDRFLLGIDMLKSPQVLERAYNDGWGVTASFNRNILDVINRELSADFAPCHFGHLAFYNADKERVEMHLVATHDMSVEIADLGIQVSVEKGETIRTEICAKFSRASAEAMAWEAGLVISRWFSDPRGWFSLVEMVRRDKE
jgi:L-histidine N-alpha-methyltransferase